MIRVRIDGLKDAIRDLKEWEQDKIRRTAMQVERSAINIERDAKNAAPVDMGILRSSIAKTVTASDKGRVVSAEVGTNVQYAPFVEFGTGAGVSVPDGQQEYALQFKGKTGHKRNMPARPFLFPAWEKERPKFVNAMEDILAKR